MRHIIIALLITPWLLLAGCASPDQIMRVRALSVAQEPSGNLRSGAFDGIDSIRRSSSAKNINILFVHGIGWTQEDKGEPFGYDLADAIAKAYGGDSSWRQAKDLCPRSSYKFNPKTDAEKALDVNGPGGLTIQVSQKSPYFMTDDPEVRLFETDLGCLDKLVVNLNDGSTISIYRFFWDDALWNAFEWVHVGFDDPAPINLLSGQPIVPLAGYDDIDGLRAPYNSELKNNLFTWGLVDAAAYLGPAGELAREGVRGAMCAAINAKTDFLKVARDGTDKKRRLSANDLCSAPAERSEPFVAMAHSLGSRVVFDVLTTDLKTDLAVKINSLPTKNIQAFFFANQIPLIGVGRIAESFKGRKEGALAKGLTFVAFSEINDILTYELVPYFEHMYYLRCFGYQNISQKTEGKYANCANTYPADYDNRRMKFGTDREARAALIQQLGFDVVDVRVSFASVIPIINLVRPDEAHSGYIKQSKSVRRLLFCGTFDDESGAVPHQNCSAKY